MIELFSDIPEAIENTINIAKKCCVMACEKPPTLPKFPTSDNLTEAQQLEIEAKKGLEERLKMNLSSDQLMIKQSKIR